MTDNLPAAPYPVPGEGNARQRPGGASVRSTASTAGYNTHQTGMSQPTRYLPAALLPQLRTHADTQTPPKCTDRTSAYDGSPNGDHQGPLAGHRRHLSALG